MDTESKNYEVAYLLSPTLNEQDALVYTGKLSSAIEECGGAIRRVETPKKRKLSYAIKKEINSYFGWTTFRMDTGRVSEFDKKVKSHTEILRFMIVEEEIETRKPFVRPMISRKPASAPIRTITPPQSSKVNEPVRQAVETEDKRLDLEALDKKLEEILGR